MLRPGSENSLSFGVTALGNEASDCSVAAVFGAGRQEAIASGALQTVAGAAQYIPAGELSTNTENTVWVLTFQTAPRN